MLIMLYAFYFIVEQLLVFVYELFKSLSGLVRARYGKNLAILLQFDADSVLDTIYRRAIRC